MPEILVEDADNKTLYHFAERICEQLRARDPKRFFKFLEKQMASIYFEVDDNDKGA